MICSWWWKRLFLPAAWLAAASGLYGSVALLDFLWNFPGWQPVCDARALALVWSIGVCSVALAVLGMMTKAGLGRTVVLLPCLFFVVLGLYMCPPEPAQPGMLGRDTPSPVWYRGGRAVLLMLPLAGWALRGTIPKVARSAPAILHGKHG